MKARLAICLLSLLGIADSIYLFTYKINLQTTLVCTFGECDRVNSSPYAMIGPIPVSFFGIVGYTAILLITLWSLNKTGRFWRLLVFLMSLGGVAFSVYLTALEAFVIRAFCQWCVISAIIMTLIFLIAAGDFKSTGQQISQSANQQ